jgi:hypothetical protein
MNRREMMALLGSAAAWPVVARAQAIPVIGVLHATSLTYYEQFDSSVRQGLGDSGLTEGRNFAIEYRWAEGQNDRLPALAADLVRQRVAITRHHRSDHAAWPRRRNNRIAAPFVAVRESLHGPGRVKTPSSAMILQ